MRSGSGRGSSATFGSYLSFSAAFLGLLTGGRGPAKLATQLFRARKLGTYSLLTLSICASVEFADFLLLGYGLLRWLGLRAVGRWGLGSILLLDFVSFTLHTNGRSALDDNTPWAAGRAKMRWRCAEFGSQGICCQKTEGSSPGFCGDAVGRFFARDARVLRAGTGTYVSFGDSFAFPLPLDDDAALVDLDNFAAFRLSFSALVFFHVSTRPGVQSFLGTQSKGQGLFVLESMPAHRTWYVCFFSAVISMTSNNFSSSSFCGTNSWSGSVLS